MEKVVNSYYVTKIDNMGILGYPFAPTVAMLKTATSATSNT